MTRTVFVFLVTGLFHSDLMPTDIDSLLSQALKWQHQDHLIPLCLQLDNLRIATFLNRFGQQRRCINRDPSLWRDNLPNASSEEMTLASLLMSLPLNVYLLSWTTKTGLWGMCFLAMSVVRLRGSCPNGRLQSWLCRWKRQWSTAFTPPSAGSATFQVFIKIKVLAESEECRRSQDCREC